MPRKILTLCIVQQGERVLLGMKKRGFGEGRWNGFGGKVMAGEAIVDAARRELEEEARIAADELEPAGRLEFTFHGEADLLEVHVFRVQHFSGQPAETEEMRPHWFAVDDIPYSLMWPDDCYWLPLLLAGRRFHGTFHFADHTTLLRHAVSEHLPADTSTTAAARTDTAAAG